jgi:hypothetical protein
MRKIAVGAIVGVADNMLLTGVSPVIKGVGVGAIGVLTKYSYLQAVGGYMVGKGLTGDNGIVKVGSW